MIADKKLFMKGTLLLVAFTVVLVAIFLPLIDGKNALDYMDSLFNSISKGSAYYIPDLQEDAKTLVGNNVTVTLNFENEAQALQMEPLFSKNGAVTSVSNTDLEVKGDLGIMMAGCLADTDLLFANDGQALQFKYDCEGKRTMYNWWIALKELDKALKRHEKFAESKQVTTIIKKAVECSYNFYGIEPQKITEQILLVLVSLIFYVVYTMWYGFAIMYMFEGWGLRLEH